MKPMTNRIHRVVAVAAFAAAIAALGLAGTASAAGKSIQTEAEWVSFDSESNTITVKVRKPGKRIKDKEIALRKGKEASFDVKPEGSVLTRTTVKINGRRGELTDIPAGKRLNIYWVVDETKSTKRFARTIDMILSEEELNERYGTEDE
ncbi:MAG: hypothetical protein ACQGVK_07350 [Myxococcota bacterium]